MEEYALHMDNLQNLGKLCDLGRPASEQEYKKYFAMEDNKAAPKIEAATLEYFGEICGLKRPATEEEYKQYMENLDIFH